MVKIYIYIAIFLIISWIIAWFTVQNLYKSLDSGEDSKIAKFFLPKDYMRNLEMIERRAQRLQKEEEERNSAEHESGSAEKSTDERKE